MSPVAVSTSRSPKAQVHGGSGGAGRFLGPGTGDEGPPPRSGTQSVMGSAIFGGGGVFGCKAVGGLQADATPVVTQQVMFFVKNEGLPCPSRLSYSIVVKGYIFKMAENRPLQKCWCQGLILDRVQSISTESLLAEGCFWVQGRRLACVSRSVCLSLPAFWPGQPTV